MTLKTASLQMKAVRLPASVLSRYWVWFSQGFWLFSPELQSVHGGSVGSVSCITSAAAAESRTKTQQQTQTARNIKGNWVNATHQPSLSPDLMRNLIQTRTVHYITHHFCYWEKIQVIEFLKNKNMLTIELRRWHSIYLFHNTLNEIAPY